MKLQNKKRNKMKLLNTLKLRKINFHLFRLRTHSVTKEMNV